MDHPASVACRIGSVKNLHTSQTFDLATTNEGQMSKVTGLLTATSPPLRHNRSASQMPNIFQTETGKVVNLK
jgi:hypothetical protein